MRALILEFVVEGSGYFPFDMLRYDHAWPASSESCEQITIRKDEYFQQRKIVLRMVWTGEFKKATPTIGRWLSFGWTVRDIKRVL